MNGAPSVATGTAIGTVASGVVARVLESGSVRVTTSGYLLEPIVHDGAGWRPLAVEFESQTLIAGGAVVETAYRSSALRIRCHAEQLGPAGAIVMEVHNDGDAPVGIGWVITASGRSRQATDDGLVIDEHRLATVGDSPVVVTGDDVPLLDQLDHTPADDGGSRSTRRARPIWGVVGRPVAHGRSARWVHGSATAVQPTMGAESVLHGWSLHGSTSTPALEVDDPVVAELRGLASVRVALGVDGNRADRVLIAVMTEQSWTDPFADHDIRGKDLRNPGSARKVLTAVAEWARRHGTDPDVGNTSANALEVGVAALTALEKRGETPDPTSCAWIAQLASQQGQPGDAVRAIATAGGAAADRAAALRGGRDDDLADRALRGWDDELIERFDRSRRRGGRLPEAFRPATARAEGDPDHAGTAAAVAFMLDRMLATEWPTGHVEVLRPVPAAWTSRPIVVRNVILSIGRLSYGLRWHDGTPALLWELDRSAGVAESLRLRTPDLVSGWEGNGDRGEELLR